MNRHTSNPFLSDWDDPRPSNINDAHIQTTNADLDKDNAAATSTRRSSCSLAELGSQSPSNRPSLYRRNMSSFEAASLTLEHQQRMQENGSVISAPNDLIAKMTAEFQSAIESNDKQFSLDGENLVIDGFNPFDPFETINDDDVSLPSPAPSKEADNSTNKPEQDCPTNDQNPLDTSEIQLPTHMELDEHKTKDIHESIDEDDDELVSTPVRNIKSSQNNESLKRHSNDLADDISNQLQNTSNDESSNTDSMAKASLFASLLASAESSGQQGADKVAAKAGSDPTEDATETNIGDPNNNVANMEYATHVIKGSPNSASDGIERPVGFFDPFETVIDKDALTSLINESQQNHSATKDEIIENMANQSHLDDKNTLQTRFAGRVADSASIETVIENASSNPVEIVHKDQSRELHQSQPVNADADMKSDPSEGSIATERPVGHTIQASSGVIPPQVTPLRRATKQKQRRTNQDDSSDSSDDDDRIQIVIRARDVTKDRDMAQPVIVPLLPPPPSKNSMKQARERGQVEEMPGPIMNYKARQDLIAKRVDLADGSIEKARNDESSDPTAKPIDRDEVDDESDADGDDGGDGGGQFVIPMTHSDDDDEGDGKPETPLYDDDTSYVLEDFPPKYDGSGWEMMLRYPPKKKLTSNRFWKKIFVRLAQVPLALDSRSKQYKNDPPQTCIALQVFDKPEDKKPMQEIPIQATYTVSEISSQLFDQFGKIFTIKLQYIFYKERVGVRQGQLARFIHTGHIGSSTTSGGHGVDPISIGAIKRMGAPIEHSPQISQIIKLGCTSYEDLKQFKDCLEDCLFKMPIQRDRALSTYKTEEVQMAVRDETYIELNQIGTIIRQLARVRLFFLSFLNGTPTVEVGINDIHRQGKEIVGRMDILPVVTEEWIRLEAWELHSTVAKEEFENPELRIIKLVPPDATFFELLRFRIRPPRNRELPLQISANMSVTRTKVSINCEVMVPGCVSRKHGQIPCENIAIRFQIPESWIYFFREEKHFRMGSKKSVNRRPGKVKGIERFLGGGGLQDFNDESSLIEVTSGQAKYEHHHQAIVWRAQRWPKESQSAYVQNAMKIRLPLTAYDKMPESFYEYVHVEYSMPATTVSHTTLRSISVNPYEDEPPEKYVKYSAKYEYKVKMRLSVNLGSRPGGGYEQEASPIIIMKQPDLQGDLQREEDSDDDENDQSDEAAEDRSEKD